MTTEVILIDTNPSSGATFGSIMEKLAADLSTHMDCSYFVDSTGHPCIKLPKVVNEGGTPVIKLNTLATNTYSSSTLDIYIGITADNETGVYASPYFPYAWAVANATYISNKGDTVKFPNKTLAVSLDTQHLDKYGFYSIGFASVGCSTETMKGSIVSAPIQIAKVKDVTKDTYVNGIIIPGIYSTSGSGGAIYIYGSSGGSWCNHLYSSSATNLVTEKLKTSLYENDNFIILHPTSCTTIQNATCINSATPSEAKNGWKRKAVVINMSYYDVLYWLSNSSSYPVQTIAIPSA